MTEATAGRHRHFLLEEVTQTEAYRYPGRRNGGSKIPHRDRVRHGGALRGQIDRLRAEAEDARGAQLDAGMEESLGLRVEFESFPDLELAFESLARERSGIELFNVRHEGNRTLATVFVPEGKLVILENLITAYLDESRDTKTGPRNHRLLNAISSIRAATLEALWTDTAEFPSAEEGLIWWEVWLPLRGERSGRMDSFRERAEVQDIEVGQGELIFPERRVLLARASLEQMQQSMVTLNSIAELRRPRETAEFFDSLAPDEQVDWLDDLLSQTRFAEETGERPYVCLLDTGVNRGHPMLAPAFDPNDLHTVEPGWGTGDTDGHGTEMAGVALAGNLTELLARNGPVEISHRLESVKLLPAGGATGADPRHHGYLTVEAVARPEVTAPARLRVFGMAVTARNNRDRGRPSAWSAAVDALAADVDGYGAIPRLLVVSGGNIDDPSAWSQYPDSNDSDGVHDPAQAWNALTVGACTDLVRITEPDAGGYSPVAPAGCLSPFSTTSLTWDRHWPIKPDVVLEGGNAARDSLGSVWMPSLSLLTTHHVPADRLFTTTNATSAATALASRFAARVMASYPRLWPETIRALIVHSAEWTSNMKRQFLPATGSPSKTDYGDLLRRCGFGVPDIDRALWSLENSLTMVVEESLPAIQAGDSRAADPSRYASPQTALAQRRPGELGSNTGRDAGHVVLLRRAQPVGKGCPFTLPVRVSRSAFRREAAVGIDRPVSEANQSGSKRRGEGNCFKQWRRPFLVHRNPGSPPRFFAQRHLARNGSGPCKSWHDRCLSHGWLVEDALCAGTIRQGCTVRSGRQHQGAGSRRGSLHRGRESDRTDGPRRKLRWGNALGGVGVHQAAEVAPGFRAPGSRLRGEDTFPLMPPPVPPFIAPQPRPRPQARRRRT